jgi:hypothetical protein
MRFLSFSNFYLPLILLICSFSFPIAVAASGCGPPPACVSYSRADAVFIGKLVKIEEDTKGYLLLAHFEVERTFKGAVSNVEIVRFRPMYEGGLTFKVGEKYFVYRDYKNGSTGLNSFCNGTVRFYDESQDFIYAKSLSETKPSFTISGSIQLLNESVKKGTKVFIENGKNNYKPLIDKYGRFRIRTTKKGTYNVKIILPFKTVGVSLLSEPFMYDDFKVIHSENQTDILYQAEFQPNSCHDREIEFSTNY